MKHSFAQGAEGGGYAGDLRTVLWAGRARQGGGGVSVPAGAEGDLDLFDHDRGLAAIAGLAHWRGVYARGDGEDGGYWKPVFNMLEGGGEVLLVNARHLTTVCRNTMLPRSLQVARFFLHSAFSCSRFRKEILHFRDDPPGRLATCHPLDISIAIVEPLAIAVHRRAGAMRGQCDIG